MADYIFTEGKVVKKDFFSKLIDMMTAAGWTNVSSNAATDFVVMNSKGESGDKDLFIQIRPTNITNVNPTDSTDYNVMSYRFVEGYTPGATGVAGTFARTTTETWTALHIVPTAVAATTNMDIELTYFYHVNKNRIIMAIETPPSTATAPQLFYLGLPDVTYTTESGSKGALCAVSSYPKANATLHISNASDGLPSETASLTRNVYATLSPKNPNSAGLYTISEILYGNNIEGIRGKLTGIYQMPNGNINNGDIITIGAKEYRVVVTHSVSSNNSFSSVTFVIQIV